MPYPHQYKETMKLGNILEEKSHYYSSKEKRDLNIRFIDTEKYIK